MSMFHVTKKLVSSQQFDTLIATTRRFVALALLGIGVLHAAEVPTKASNFGGITNTRHNMTQSYLTAIPGWMSISRNDYGEVCVYCHTPHGANTNVAAPLWNRTIKETTYNTYDKLGTSTASQTYSQPGAGSLPCLSCHDGQVAIDSIINMPGSGRYDASQGTAQNSGFLDSWPGGPGESFYGGHGNLNNSAAAMNEYGSCMSCHSVNGNQNDPNYIPTFDVFYIGTDLRNDHPVGVTFPTTTGVGTDWRTPTGAKTVNGLTTKFFDENGNTFMDKGDIRLYNTGEGPEVECASCHDPHGVTGSGGLFNKTFLRKENTGSAVCLTCHIKYSGGHAVAFGLVLHQHPALSIFFAQAGKDLNFFDKVVHHIQSTGLIQSDAGDQPVVARPGNLPQFPDSHQQLPFRVKQLHIAKTGI